MKEGLRLEGPAGAKQKYVCFMMGERVEVGMEEALMIRGRGCWEYGWGSTWERRRVANPQTGGKGRG